MISVHERFHVPSDPDTVWRIVSNPEEVVPCIPGAALEERHEDGSFSGCIVVQFGPAKVKFNARVTFEADHVAKVGRVTGRGKDMAGGTRAEMAFTFSVGDDPAGTTVAGDGEMDIKGRLASMIEAGASVVVKRMLAEFSHNLTARCAPPAISVAPKKSVWQRMLQALRQLLGSRTGLKSDHQE